MIKTKTHGLIKGIMVIFCAVFLFGSLNAQSTLVPLQIDGAKRLQQLDGIGVNANTRSWNGDELKPALNLLLDSMNFNIWRVVVETVENWEVVNDNEDPFTFNWDFYNQLYETPKFQKAWDMIQYLNDHVEVKWSSIKELTGRIELVCNGKIVAIQEGKARPGEPGILKTKLTIKESNWICARRMEDKGHQSHTAPVYITVKNAPIRACAEDAQYFVRWIDNILVNIKPGGPWNQYFIHDLNVVQKRYEQARDVYKRIAMEVKKTDNP
jgi:hypothetical protein